MPAIIGPLPNTLVNGTTADANQVMADLNFIKNSVNANAADGSRAAYTDVVNTFTQPQNVVDAVTQQQVPNVEQVANNTFKYDLDTGAANAYVVTPAIAWTSYVEGADLYVKIGAGNSNTLASTVNVSGLGPKNIFGANGASIPAGTLVAGRVYHLIYDGTQFELMGPALTTATQATTDTSRLIASTAFVKNVVAAAFSFAGGLALPPWYIQGFTLTNNGSTAFDIADGAAADSTNTSSIIGGAITGKTQNSWVAGSAAGGKLHAAGMANNTWYYWYALWKTSDGSVDYGFDVSAVSPTLPAGYSKWRYIGARKTIAISTTWEPFIQHGDQMTWTTPPFVDVNGTSISTGSRTLTPVNVPAVRVEWLGQVVVSEPGIQSGGLYITDPLAADIAPGALATPLASQFINFNQTGLMYGGGQVRCWTNTSSQVGLRAITASAIYVQTIGWIDPRGKPV